MTDPQIAPERFGVPYDALPGFSRLFVDYADFAESIRPYYAGDYRSLRDLSDSAARAAAHPRDREALADALLAQNARWDLDDATRLNIERLRDPESVAVVTGQQLGLLGGPLYTVLKTLTAIELAARLEKDLSRPVVPVFWLEGEDHDFEEVAWVSVAGGGGAIRTEYRREVSPGHMNHGPVGRLLLDDGVGAIFEWLRAILPQNDFREEVLRALERAYAPGQSMRSAFARSLSVAFPESGLVFASPDDAALKKSLRPLFLREVAECGRAGKILEATSGDLEKTYHAQIRPGGSNLFMFTERGRVAVDLNEDCGSASLRGADRTMTTDELRLSIENDPEKFSPNVVLRPIAQDTLLPTAVYVAGPAEVAYFAQMKSIYEWAGIPMPVIYPRASVTVLPSRSAAQLAEIGLTVGALARPVEELFALAVESRMEVDLDQTFDAEIVPLAQVVDRLRAIAESVDPTLAGTAEAMRTALHKEVDRFKGRVRKAEKSKHDVLRGRLERLREQVFPFDGMQERTLSAAHFLCRYGPGFADRLREQVSLDTSEHQVVILD